MSQYNLFSVIFCFDFADAHQVALLYSWEERHSSESQVLVKYELQDLPWGEMGWE
jgi:hypothetical protein